VTPAEAGVDALYAIDDNHLYARGWLARAAGLTSLQLVTPGGVRVDLASALHRVAAGPSTQDNFVAYVVAPGGEQTGDWELRVARAGAPEVTVPAPPPVRGLAEVQRGILADVTRDRPNDDTLIRAAIHPALSQLQRRRTGATAELVSQYGPAAGAGRVTIIVPLYRRIDLLHHQLAAFAVDGEVAGADLIYVLDSPELSEQFLAVAPALYDLYRVPFRGVVLTENAGYAAANCVAAGLARGRLLLLLNSDVFPVAPGWLSAMTAFYDSIPGVGALGPRLLYEDHSIQHAGLYFRRYEGSPVWTGFHPFEGLHRTFPLASVARPVPAICGACLLVDRDLFDTAGGLRTMYLHGGYEDSDLCLRLGVLGRENWYLPAVELYHLSGQSYDPATRVPATRYNAWLHTQVWGDRIATVMARLDPYAAWAPG
jgi:GT2 family glycosyltransferase